MEIVCQGKVSPDARALDPEAERRLDQIDEETKDNITKIMWMASPDIRSLHREILDQITSDKNSNRAFGERMRYRLKDLLDHPESFTPSYKRRYEVFMDHSSSLSPHQACALTTLLGLDSCRGYREIPRKADLSFPKDEAPQFDYQLGWHFFAGTCLGQNGKEYGVEFMFLQSSLLPPSIARHFDLTDIENQVLELHLGISEAGDRHYRSKPFVVAGTTGLINFQDDPFTYTMGKNALRSLQKGSLFPLRLQAWGVSLEGTDPVEMAIDLTLSSSKKYLLNGASGCQPCCGGVGTLYYSASNLRLDPSKSALNLKGEEVPLKWGKLWYDHQWCNGFVPAGSPRCSVMRAVNNLSPASPEGWDWFPVQFDDDREMTLSSLHSNECRGFYCQTGPNPPGAMAVKVIGKYVDVDGTSKDVQGTMKVTEWVRSERSPDLNQYQITNTWYPNRWEFSFGQDLPEEAREFYMEPIVGTGQTGFSSDGTEYSEGATYVKDKEGRLIGRGFAESPWYADTVRNCLVLAGLPGTPEMINLVRRQPPSWALKIWSMIYVNWPPNKAKMNRLVKDCIENGVNL